MANRKKMPRPKSSDTENRVPEISPENPSPAGVYVRLNGLSITSMARIFGVKWATMNAWCDGTQEPGIAETLEWARISKGVVMPEMWGALPSVRRRIAELRTKQPKDAMKEIRLHGDSPSNKRGRTRAKV